MKITSTHVLCKYRLYNLPRKQSQKRPEQFLYRFSLPNVVNAAGQRGKEKLRAIAVDLSNEKSLTRALAQMLIDKVAIYPDNRIEITWKIEDSTMLALFMLE